MLNLKHFFHYHKGLPRWQCVKIGASLLGVLCLFVLAGSIQAMPFFEETSYMLSMLVPEPIAPALAEETSILTTPTEPDEGAAASPAAKEHQEDGNFEDSEKREKFDRDQVLKEKKDLLRELKDQKNELARTCKQLARLKGAATDAAACRTLAASVAKYESELKAPPLDGSDIDALRDFMNEYRELNIWDELNTLRLKANLPKELNQFFNDLLRLQKLLAQKEFQKIPGLNYDLINAKVVIIKDLHAQAKACYTAGEFECANEKLNEARNDNYPGELEGPLHILRGIFESLRRIKNEEVKTEVQGLIQPSIDSINKGDWREANQELNELNKDLMSLLENLMRSQYRNRSLSPDARARLEKLLQKYGGATDSNGEDRP